MFISVSLPLPSSSFSSSSPSSVGISVGGVSLDLCCLMLTAANLLRLTTKQAGDKLFFFSLRSRKKGALFGIAPLWGNLPSPQTEQSRPWSLVLPWPARNRMHTCPDLQKWRGHKAANILSDGVNELAKGLFSHSHSAVLWGCFTMCMWISNTIDVFWSLFPIHPSLSLSSTPREQHTSPPLLIWVGGSTLLRWRIVAERCLCLSSHSSYPLIHKISNIWGTICWPALTSTHAWAHKMDALLSRALGCAQTHMLQRRTRWCWRTLAYSDARAHTHTHICSKSSSRFTSPTHTCLDFFSIRAASLRWCICDIWRCSVYSWLLKNNVRIREREREGGEEKSHV